MTDNLNVPARWGRDVHDKIEEAIDAERLIVKVGKNWWLAVRNGPSHTWGDEWQVPVRAGPHRRRGQICSDPALSREWRILPPKKV